VSLNTVDNIETFLADIKNGRWEAVLPQIAHLRLPTAKLFELYEQVVLEMLELRETEAARIMLQSMKVFRRLKQEDPERYSHLESLCNPCDPPDLQVAMSPP
jgi:WD40 repeat-containing protein SMU1